MEAGMHASRMKYYASTTVCLKFHLAATARYGKLNLREVAAFVTEMALWTFSFVANNPAFLDNAFN